MAQGGLNLENSHHNATVLYPNVKSATQKLQLPLPTVATAAEEVAFWTIEVWIRLASIDNSGT